MKLKPQDLEKVTLPEPTLPEMAELSSESTEINTDVAQVSDNAVRTDEQNDENKVASINMPQNDFADLTYRATVGAPLAEGMPKALREDIISALRAVQDPELFLSVYDLGLIYELNQSENGDVEIVMSLTSPTCPIAGEMPAMVANAVASVPGTGIVTVELTFDPPWTTDRLSDEIKILMGID